MCCFCGCSKHEVSDIVPVTSGFKSDFYIEDSDLSGELSVNSEGDLSLVFSGPDIINGTGIRVKEESVIIEVQGISERYSREESPSDSPALYIYDCLTAVKNAEPTLTDGKITLRGKCKSGDYTVILNGTGFITELELLDIDTTVLLRNHVETK